MFFNTFDVTYTPRTKLYTFNCNLGTRFKHALTKMGYNLPKQKYLFYHYTQSSFSIHRFFLPDLEMICNTLLSKGSDYDINMVTVKKVIEYITALKGDSNQHSVLIDFNRIKSGMKYQPLPNQLPAYERYSEIIKTPGMRGMLLDGAVGVGKTYISLSMSVGLNSAVTLIIAPLQTIDKVWNSSLTGEGCLYKQPQPTHDIGTNKDYLGEKYILCHYENLGKLDHFIKSNNLSIDMIIVDEVHNFNDLKSNRTNLLIELLDKHTFKHAIGMSGTPVKAKATDLIPLLKLINSDFDNKVMSRFLKIYNRRGLFLTLTMRGRYESSTAVLKKEDMKIPELKVVNLPAKLKNSDKYTLDNIRTRLSEFLTKRMKELTVLRPKATADYNRLLALAIPVALEKKKTNASDIKKYKSFVQTIVNVGAGGIGNIIETVAYVNRFEKTIIEPILGNEDRKIFREVKTIHKYPELKAQGEALANIVMRARIDCYSELAATTDILDKLISSAAKKSIIFSNYIQVCASATTRCKAYGLQPITVYGDTTKLLTTNVNIFTNNPKINPMIATYKSLSTGVPMIAANVCIIFGLPHRQYLFDQAIGRAWRTGQDKPVFAYVIELDTGDKYNITDRDLDIITFFRKEVTNLTGNDSAIAMDRNNGIGDELGITGFLETQDDYLNKMKNKVFDIIDLW